MLVLLVAGCASNEPRSRTREAGRVARVTDGDTLRLADGRRVRLVQVDAPELDSECYAEAAAAVLRRLAPPGTRVTLESDPDLDAVDRHGRLLRYVLSGRTNVNLELVRAGAAAPYFYRGDRGEHATALLDAADEARAAKRGLWSACPLARLAPTRALASGPS